MIWLIVIAVVVLAVVAGIIWFSVATLSEVTVDRESESGR